MNNNENAPKTSSEVIASKPPVQNQMAINSAKPSLTKLAEAVKVGNSLAQPATTNSEKSAINKPTETVKVASNLSQDKTANANDKSIEFVVLKNILDGFKPKENAKIKSEIIALRAQRRSIQTALENGATNDKIYASLTAKGFTLSAEKFGEVVAVLAKRRPRISRRVGKKIPHENVAPSANNSVSTSTLITAK